MQKPEPRFTAFLPASRHMAGAAVTAGLVLLAACASTPQQREAQHMQRGRNYVAKKDYKKAVIEYKVASQNAPKDAEPVYQLGLTYLLGGAPRQAMEAFTKAVGLDPKHEGARYQEALFKVGSNKPEVVEDARIILTEYVKSHPASAEAMGALALAEAKTGSKEEAIRLAIASAEKDPSNMRPAGTVIALLAAKGDVEPVKQMARDITGKAPNSPAAAVLRAQVAMATNNQAEANAEISRALSLQRDFQPALQLRLRQELSGSDIAGAEQTTKEMTASQDKRLWGTYGRMLFLEKKPDAAIAEYKRALQEHKDDNDLRDEYSGMLMDAGKGSDAGAVIDGTLKKNAKDTTALLQRATLEIDKGDLTGAEATVKAIQERKAFSPQLSFQQARIFGAQGQLVRQGDMLNEALKRNPRFIKARLELTRVMLESGKAKDATTILEEASGREKQTYEYLYYHNAALMASGNWDEARKGVDRALGSMRSPGFLYQDARLRMHGQDFAGARKSLDAALKVAPTDQAALNLMSEVMARSGKSGEFVASLKQNAAKNSTSANVQMTLGRQLAASGDLAGARAAFEAARTAGSADADIEIAVLDMRSGATDKAKQRLSGIVKTHDSAGARILLAEIETKNNGHDAALQQYLAALKLEPTNAMVMNNMAGLLASRPDKLDDALFWGLKALAAAPNNPVVEDTVGWTYYLQGKYDKALPYLEKSLKDLQRPVAHYHLAAAMAKTGDPHGGQKEYEVALKQDPKSPERAAVEAALQGKPGK